MGEGNGDPLQYSCLENAMDRGACQATAHRVTKSWTRLKRHSMHGKAGRGTDISLQRVLCFSSNCNQFHWVKSSVQFSSVAQLCPTLCDPMNHSTPGLPVHHQLPESTQTHVHWVGDSIQPSHPLLSPSPPAPNLSQHQGIFKWVSSSQQVAKVLEFQLQHSSFQCTPRTDLL